MTATITRGLWNAIPADYKDGRPAAGTARMLRYTVDRGITLVPVVVVERARLFDPGPVVVDPMVRPVLAGAGYDVDRFLGRHLAGDWGHLPSLAQGARIVSQYRLSGWSRLRITTDAALSASGVPGRLVGRPGTTVVLDPGR